MIDISCEEAILKNESSGNSYTIIEPSKMNIFPYYLIGVIKSIYIINNERYIGEGIGILIGEDIILTSAHNLIFSELKDKNIKNYKPNKITFHLLHDGHLELIKPLECNPNTIIFSENFDDYIFEKNVDLKSKEINNFKNKNDKNIKSRSTDFTNNKKKNNINNISEISLPDDYSIIFTEQQIGSEILKIFLEDSENINLESFRKIEKNTKLFSKFEEHINFIEFLEKNDKYKFENSKISMVSFIKYNENLLGTPQFVYSSNFNDLNNKFSKNKKALLKNFNIINFDDENKTKMSLLSKITSIKSQETWDNSFDIKKNLIPILNEINKKDLKNENISNSIIIKKFEKELKYSLLINIDKNSKKKYVRNSKIDNLQKLTFFNNEEFFSEGKSVLCQANGKMCSLIYEKNKIKKNNNDITEKIKFTPTYEVNHEELTPFFKNNGENENTKNEISFCDLNNMNDYENKDFPKTTDNKNEKDIGNKSYISNSQFFNKVNIFRGKIFFYLKFLDKSYSIYSKRTLNTTTNMHDNTYNLLDQNKNNNISNELNYMITTYKGQSGSPLFIRMKNEKLIEMKMENLITCRNDKYSYIFMGLHSRSPDYIEPINALINNITLSSINEKVLNLNTNTIDININLNNQPNFNLKINLKSLLELEKSDKNEIYKYTNVNQLLKEKTISEFLKKNNYCSYNLGLKIDRETYYKIKSSIITYRIKQENISLKEKIHEKEYKITKIPEFSDSEFPRKNSDKKLEKSEFEDNNYFLIYFYIYDEYIVKGFFNYTSRVDILYEIAGKYLDIDKKFLILTYNNKNLSLDNCKSEYIENTFKISDTNKERNSKIFKEILKINFTIEIEKFSDVIKDKLCSKLNENIKNFSEIKFFDNSKNDNLKIVINYIFNEIQCFHEKSNNLFGLLFNAIKNKIIISS